MLRKYIAPFLYSVLFVAAQESTSDDSRMPPLVLDNTSVQIPAQEWPRMPGPRSITVYVNYPGSSLDNVTAETGLMLSLHNWGGTRFEGTADPDYLSDRYNVITIGVDYVQSGDKHDENALPYDFGLYQAIDALHGLYYVYDGLKQGNIPFAADRIFAAGGSGGGNVSHMANKLAPRTFACIVDLSGMAKLSDDIAYKLDGGSTLNARYDTDSASTAYLSPDEQQIRFIGNPEHLPVMKQLGNRARIVIIHGTEDASCPVEDKRELVDNMTAAGLAVDAHLIETGDIDGKIVKNTHHSIGNRTQMVSKFADAYLSPESEFSAAALSNNDFELRDRKVRYKTENGTYEVSYERGAPVLSFIED